MRRPGGQGDSQRLGQGNISRAEAAVMEHVENEAHARATMDPERVLE